MIHLQVCVRHMEMKAAMPPSVIKHHLLYSYCEGRNKPQRMKTSLCTTL